MDGQRERETQRGIQTKRKEKHAKKANITVLTSSDSNKYHPSDSNITPPPPPSKKKNHTHTRNTLPHKIVPALEPRYRLKYTTLEDIDIYVVYLALSCPVWCVHTTCTCTAPTCGRRIRTTVYTIVSTREDIDYIGLHIYSI